MITELSIRHFKAIVSAAIPLGPITVLVGPNDSGKSTILQALMALSRCGEPGGVRAEQLLACAPREAATFHDGSSRAENIEIAAAGLVSLGSKEPQYPYRYMMKISSQTNEFAAEVIGWNGGHLLSAESGRPSVVSVKHKGIENWQGTSTELSRFASSADVNPYPPTKPIFAAIANDLKAALLRLDACAIARPSPLGASVLPDGSGLVGIVDELLTSGVGHEQIGRVNEAIRELSPHVEGVAAKLHRPSGGKVLHFVLRSGAVVPASLMSDGIVLATAIVLISLCSGPQRVLIEGLENGLHPRQLKVIADAVRSIAETQGTQIVLTTHSPLLLNHFAAEEVVLVTRDQEGVHVQRMSEARQIADLAPEMALGELWYNVGDSNLARPA